MRRLVFVSLCCSLLFVGAHAPAAAERRPLPRSTSSNGARNDAARKNTVRKDVVLRAVKRLGRRSRSSTILRTLGRFHQYKHHMRADLQLQVATTALSNRVVTRLTNLRQFQGERLALLAEGVQGIMRLKGAAEAVLADEQASPARRRRVAKLIRSHLGDVELFEALLPRRSHDGSHLADYGLDAQALGALAERLAPLAWPAGQRPR